MEKQTRKMSKMFPNSFSLFFISPKISFLSAATATVACSSSKWYEKVYEKDLRIGNVMLFVNFLTPSLVRSLTVGCICGTAYLPQQHKEFSTKATVIFIQFFFSFLILLNDVTWLVYAFWIIQSQTLLVFRNNKWPLSHWSSLSQKQRNFF